MAELSKNTEQKYLLNGVKYNAPEGWEDSTIVAEYLNDNIQPSLSISKYTFPLEAKKAIEDWFHGPIGGFEGMPFELVLYNNQSQQVSFKSILDFYTDYEELLEDDRVNVSLLKEDGIDNLYNQLEALTYGFLELTGNIGQSDYTTVDYVVEKKFNLFEILMSTVITFLMVKELAESIRSVIDNAIKFTAALTPSFGTGVTGPVVIPVSIGGIIYATISLVIQVLYTAILLIAIINLATNLFNTLVPFKRKHKAILLRTALQKVADYLGYGLVMPDPLFNIIHYLPSNPRLDEKTSSGFIQSTKGTPTGIPNVQDYGYNCVDMFNLAKELIRGKIAVINGDIHIRTISDPFWIKQTLWQMPSINIESRKYNLNELKATKVIQFKTDQRDEWTIDNYKGTAYEIHTRPITIQNPKAVLLRGIDEVNFNVALGNRKDELNAIENFLKGLGKLVDKTTRVFGGGTNFAGKLDSKKGVLKQSENWHSIPKLIPLIGGRMPTNHRDIFNAKLLWDNYLSYDSFIKNNYKRQRRIYTDVEIPFGIEDFKKLTINPYFPFQNGIAKMTNFTWTTGQDRAKISFWVEYNYTTNLVESYIEPQ